MNAIDDMIQEVEKGTTAVKGRAENERVEKTVEHSMDRRTMLILFCLLLLYDNHYFVTFKSN